MNAFFRRTARVICRCRSWMVPGLVLLFGLLITAGLWFFSGQQARDKSQLELELMTDRMASALEGRIRGDVQILRGVMGLFHASNTVNRSEFNQYVESLSIDDLYPGIQGIGFAQVINPEQREAHVQSMRNEGFPRYEIRTTGQQDLLTSIVYLEPFDERNRRAFGFDMYSEATRRAAMEHARRTGKAALSGQVTLLQETDTVPQAGVLLYVPIFKDQRKPDIAGSVLLGWAYAPIRVGNLMRSLINRDLSDFVAHVDVALYSVPRAETQALLFKTERFNSNADERLQAARIINMAGQSWLLQVRDLDLFAEYYGNQYQRIILVAGVTISFLLSLLIWTRNRALLAKNAQALRQAHAIIESSEDAVISFTMDFNITSWNNGASVLFGYHADEMLGKSVLLLIPDDYRDEFSCLLQILENGERVRHLETKRLHKNGQLLDISVSTSPIFDEYQNVVGIAKIAHDISERKRLDEQIRRLAFHDTLTQLPNRRLLSERLQSLLTLQKRSPQYGALFFMDLDNFKPLNDRYGHEVGDLLLIAVAERLQTCVREGDTVARFGGDEFVVMVSALDMKRDVAAAQALMCAKKILATLSEPYYLSACKEGSSTTVEHRCSASIGGILFANDGLDESELIKRADIAMYQAKEAGRGVIRFFNSHSGESI